jgi:hypothetical protein
MMHLFFFFGTLCPSRSRDFPFHYGLPLASGKKSSLLRVFFLSFYFSPKNNLDRKRKQEGEGTFFSSPTPSENFFFSVVKRIFLSGESKKLEKVVSHSHDDAAGDTFLNMQTPHLKG